MKNELNSHNKILNKRKRENKVRYTPPRTDFPCCWVFSDPPELWSPSFSFPELPSTDATDCVAAAFAFDSGGLLAPELAAFVHRNRRFVGKGRSNSYWLSRSGGFRRDFSGTVWNLAARNRELKEEQIRRMLDLRIKAEAIVKRCERDFWGFSFWLLYL